jgi:hypothetical protein
VKDILQTLKPTRDLIWVFPPREDGLLVLAIAEISAK